MSELLVADSFGVRLNPATGAAEVRGLDRHIERFSRAAREASGGALDGLDDFLDEARARMAEFGAGFPRWELWGEGEGFELRLSLRPLPEPSRTLELRTAGHVRVRHPNRKGPNIARYAALNRSLGAEALLSDERGDAVEGATTSLLWWRHDTLCSAAAEGRVPSVTEALVRQISAQQRIPVARCRVGAEDLAEHEVWAVNALHGIRAVTNIDGAETPAPDERRLHRFREGLDRTWEPLLPLR